jgi:hypothetical protein
MQNYTFIAAAALILVPLAVPAGQQDWTHATNQSGTAYAVNDGKGNSLNISCSGAEGSLLATADIDGKTISSDNADIDFIVDGDTYRDPFNTHCPACTTGFPFFWNVLREAKNLKISASGKSVILPTKNIQKALPALKPKQSLCNSP